VRSLAERQLELIARMASLDPPPWFMGGYAEDALLAGTVTRPHLDVDWLFPRRELDLRLEQCAQLGFAAFETWGEAAPGEPFYLFGENGDLRLDLGIADESGGQRIVRVHSLAFEVDGRPAPSGYQVHLPEDLFEYPEVELDGIALRPASPLGLYQLRVGIASQGSFGELSERQRASARNLRETFYPGASEEELAPSIEPLP
jgi:hypothetical protein